MLCGKRRYISLNPGEHCRAAALLEDHGGSLSLQNRAAGGVRATIALPKTG